MSDELKKCPLCEVPPEPWKPYQGVHAFRHPDVGRDKCLLSGFIIADTAYDITAWNTRPREDALQEENKKLREALMAISSISDQASVIEIADDILCEERP